MGAKWEPLPLRIMVKLDRETSLLLRQAAREDGDVDPRAKAAELLREALGMREGEATSGRFELRDEVMDTLPHPNQNLAGGLA